MRYKTLKSEDTHNLKRKSSVFQHGGMLSVLKNGEWCPLVYDVIDSVKCGKIYSHPSAVADKHELGYTFPVKTCKYVSDLYVLHDVDTSKTVRLPQWFGAGFYKKRVRELDFVNADNGALGIHEERCLRVGEDYVIAKKLLVADK